MALDFDGGGGQYLSRSTSPITGYPFSMSIWYQPDTVGWWDGMCALYSGAPSGDSDGLSFYGGDTPTHLVAFSWFGGSGYVATATAAHGSGWNHGCGVWSGIASRKVYLNGGHSAEETTSGRNENKPNIYVGIHPTLYGIYGGFDGRLGD